jgi:hypothetical protein
MTQKEFDDAVDAVTEEQLQLDNQQNGVEAPSSITKDEVRQMLDQHFQSLRKEVSGLQSGWDRGLNAIRGDMRKEMDDKINDMHSQAGKTAFLNNIEDPEQRQNFQYILENQERLTKGNQQYNNYNQQPDDAQQQSQQQQAIQQQQLEQVYAYVEDRGVSRQDSRIRYDYLTDASLTPEQRKQGFYDSVEAARTASRAATQQQPSPGTQERPSSNTVNPPVEGGGRSSGNSGSRQDADLNLYLTNEISRDEFLKRQPNFRR